MANVKITELFATTSPASTDVLVVVDLPADVTKKVTIADLLENAGNGSETAPAFAFSSDSNTGIFLEAADKLGFSTNGVGRIYINGSGNIGIAKSNPTQTLDVNGTAAVSGALTQGGNNVVTVGDTGTVTSTMIADGTIVDADVSATAEIAVSKLANGTARQLLQTDAAGTGVEFTSDVDVPGTLDVTGVATFDDNVTVGGNLTVNGTTTTIDSTTLVVEDKNIELGVVTTPTDGTADGGGITLKGTTDKTINWVNSTDAWTLSEHVNIASAKEYRIDGTKVLDATSLGSAVVSSSLTSVGTIGTGVWNGTPIATAYIADSSVTSAKIVNGTIVDADVNASAAIGLSKLATGALPTGITVASANIVDGTIVDADVNASAAIGLSKLATGALPTGITVASANIVAGAVDTSELASGSVTSPKIDNNAVITAKIADNTVTTAKIVNIAVTTAKIADDAVTADKIANGAVTNAKLQADSVGTGKIQDNAVNGDKLANDITIANNLTVTNNLTVNGTRINSSGNIGVGITSPISKLHLHKASADGFDGLRFTNTTTGITATDGFVIGLNDSEEGKIWHYDNKSIQFGVDNELHGTLRQDGRWCLGEDQTSGSTTLNVFRAAGSSAVFHADSEPGIEIQDDSDNSVVEIRHDSGQMVIDLDHTNQVTGESFVIKRDGTSANETELFRIDSSGNVGLGVATPDEKLHVRSGHIVIGQSSGGNTGIRNYIKFGREANPKAAIGFINNSSNGKGDIIFMNNNINDGNAFGDADEIMRIVSSGNVGIGTSSPTALLSVQSTEGLSTTLDSETIVITTGVPVNPAGTTLTPVKIGSRRIVDGGNSGSQAEQFIRGNRGGISFDRGQAGGNAIAAEITYSTDNYVTREQALTVRVDGNVGIGTSSPAQKLEISSSGPRLRLTDNNTAAAYSTSYVEFYGSDHRSAVAYTNSDGFNIQADANGGKNIIFRTDGNTEKMRIDEDGQVGIGTTSPGTKLEVNGDIGIGRDAGGYTFRETVGGDVRAGIHSNANNDLIFKTGASVEEVRVRSGAGITFNGDTAEANALDDYEEGNWTPIYGGSGGNPTVTYDQQHGRYVKIGKLVHCEGRIRTDAVSGGSGNLRLSGLPFAAMNEANTRGSFFPTFTVGWSTNVPTQGRVRQNVSYVDLHRMTSTSVSTNMLISDLSGGTNRNDMHFVISYRAKT